MEKPTVVQPGHYRGVSMDVHVQLSTARADIQVGDEVFDDSGINGWGVVTTVAENKIEAEWHPKALGGMAEKRWVSRGLIRRTYRRLFTNP